MSVKIKLAAILVVIAGALLAAFPSFSQTSSDSFDSKFGKGRNISLEINYDNAEKIDDSVYGILILSKDRWKNWVLRISIILSIFIAVLVIFISMPKNNEFNLILSYFFSGNLFVLSFWTTLCGWMLIRLNKGMIGTGFMVLSGIMYVVFYICLVKVKKSDISLSTLKESFQKLQNKESEDPRLAAISGLAGDWVEDDILR